MAITAGIRRLHPGNGSAAGRYQRERNEREQEEGKYEDPGLHSSQELTLMQYIRPENEASDGGRNPGFSPGAEPGKTNV